MKIRVIHPLLMAMFPVFFLYAINVNQAQARDMLEPLWISVVAVLILWGILGLAFRSAQAGALAASLFFVLFATYGHLFTLYRGYALGNFILVRAKIMLPLWALLFSAGILFILRKRKKGLESLTSTANLFSLILVFVSLAQVVFFSFNHAFIKNGGVPAGFSFVSKEMQKPYPSAVSASQANLPDIYYIIPDSYEAGSSLKEVFGYDNSPFTDYLKSKGFFVASRSTSNYAFTALSLTSSLNMQYLNSLSESMGLNSGDVLPIEHMMANNQVMKFLKSRGYTIINAGSWWGLTARNKNADINLHAGHFNEFTLKFVRSTLLLPFSEEFTQDDRRNTALSTFKNLAEIPLMKAPTFTLAHIICPHPPFIFGPDGSKVPRTRRILSKNDPRDLYRDQVIFVNSMLRKSVEMILARSQTPPIIIIQGDHGAAYTHRTHGRAGLLPDEAYLQEQMRILNAYYLPGLDRRTLSDSITPVNTFRMVFNAYFNLKLPLLANENFYSTSDKPYAFKNVTDKVRYR